MSADFVHLHVHTQYSLLDGACHVDKLVSYAAEMGMPALAITDHGNMFGAVKFYQYAKKKGIKPIIGVEAYVTQGSHLDRQKDGKLNHLLLLVKDAEGYANLIKLVSDSYVNGFYYKPRIDKELLRQHSKGLIACSACLAGEVSQHLLNGNMEAAMASADEYRQMMGDGNYYLEIMENGIPEQTVANEGLVKISKELGIPLVATNDVHYLKKEHAFAHEVLLCVQTGNTMQDEKRMKMTTDAFYLKSAEEMKEAFAYAPEAVTNTLEIAEKCNFDFDFSNNYLPTLPMPDGMNDDQYLENLCRQELPKRYDEITPEIEDRLATELKIIREMGFSSYFIIVYDLLHYAHNNGVSVGPGRGSAAGSIVAYLLQITQLCPLKYNLLFERFLNPERISMPDIDIDFCPINRQKVVDYVTEKYGQDRIAQIVTFGSLLAKGVIRDVGRALDFTYAEADKISKMIPDELGINLEKAMEINPEMQAVYNSDPKVKQLLDVCMVLEGLSRHTGIHAAGTVIGDVPLDQRVPLYRTSEGQIATGYEMKALEAQGMLKMDFLGLKTLTLIDEAVRVVKEYRGVEIDWDEVPLDDGPTYKLLAEGDTVGVFQLESGGMRELLRKFKPDVFEDIIAILALYRPGPLNSGMVDDYVNRKQGLSPVTYAVPQLENILKETYGVIVYQEQVMQIASALGGFTLAEADQLRRAMGKKLIAVLDEKRADFLDGAKKKEIDEGIANDIYDLMCKFAEYGFNKSHSAAYALVTYRTAYLKANYPVEFMAALLTAEKNNPTKIVEYVAQTKEMGMKVLPPHINESNADFTVVSDDEIRFGLYAVKNVGEAPVDNIISQRKEAGEYNDLFDMCSRLDSKTTNKKVLESLIKCGAMDCFGKRSALIAGYPNIVSAASHIQKEQESDQFSLFGGGQEESRSLFGTSVELPDVPEWSDEDRLAAEREMLGFYVSGHPLGQYTQILSSLNITSILDVRTGRVDKKGSDQVEMTLACVFEKTRIMTTRKSKKLMAMVRMEDGTSFMEGLAFPKAYENVKEHLVEGNKVLVKGKVTFAEQEPKMFVDSIVPLTHLYEHLSVLSIYLEEQDKASIATIKEIFSKYPGGTEVHIHFSHPELRFVRIKPKQDYFVDPCEDLLVELREILGRKKVTVDIDID